MKLIATARQAARPSGVVIFAALGQAAGGLLVLGWAYAWSDWLREGGLAVGLILLGLGLIGCGLALLPTHVLSLLCGWSLGIYGGFALALLAATAASPVGYAIGRGLAGPGMIELIRRYPRGASVCEAITRASAWRAGVLVGLLRLSPIVPYGSTNVLAAIFRVPLRPFVLGTLLGLAPRVLVVVGLGAGLERLDFSRPASVWLVVVGVGATVLALVLMGWVTRQTLRRYAELPAGDLVCEAARVDAATPRN